MKRKTHKGLSKRIRRTSTGKIQRRSASISHLLRKKSKARKRRHANYRKISSSDRKTIKKLMPY